jgi:hypothetical protein
MLLTLDTATAVRAIETREDVSLPLAA